MLEFYKVEYSKYADMVRKFYPCVPEEELREVYDNIRLPERGTARSAAYDFYAPFTFEVEGNERFEVPTGIGFRSSAVNIQLLMLPRSGLSNKGLHVMNVVPLIDNDYCEADNGGQIVLRFFSLFGDKIKVEQGSKMIQGMFIRTYTVDNDSASADRVGGWGSTDNSSTQI